jgi:hypothetical protein
MGDMVSSNSTQQQRVAQSAADDSNVVHSRIIFLSAQDQYAWYGQHPFARYKSYRSFVWKNVVSLFAIYHDAEAIYDFDDDGLLLAGKR